MYPSRQTRRLHRRVTLKGKVNRKDELEGVGVDDAYSRAAKLEASMGRPDASTKLACGARTWGLQSNNAEVVRHDRLIFVSAHSKSIRSFVHNKSKCAGARGAVNASSSSVPMSFVL